HLELEPDVALLAGRAGDRAPRRAVDRTLEVHVALAALPALGDQQALAVSGEVADLLVGFDVDDRGADRHADHAVRPALAAHLLAHAILAALGAELAQVAEVDQRVEALVRDQPHRTAGTAVAAVRAAERDELLAAETHAAVAAVAGA